ncbi:hypothetical protein PS9374_05686 [Planomonospora sphaerica]|uniref:Uncharacterized protein n=3 Tax=Planomonospora TaxID=1998 RepID=A0A161LR32_9ACTN|nr:MULTISPECIES: hypothetical protein [Planomonospora]GAT70006.1 hypothetical protein PS9374_05686 [Planomonospora sphaerica]GGK84070.1 hypothetical protein GCM10010126_49160 [Planomonospora parontospora]GGL15703.1 hypothetical protein GCM10014719_17220 [Planomonospora parontospora subsp. antibiotica]GII10533.1 hypothetical protein Ppa06_43310 [Planomonospora parontospora subsp. parontospora]GII15996.1 hypothetical protein Ppa05_27220 [Planomonospora parontospora subsp. antibiotica]
MRMIRRMGMLAVALAVPLFVVLMSGTAEAIRIANHCEPPLDAD